MEIDMGFRLRIVAKFVFLHYGPNDRSLAIYLHARAATAAMLLPLTATRSNYTVKYYADALRESGSYVAAAFSLLATALISIPL